MDKLAWLFLAIIVATGCAMVVPLGWRGRLARPLAWCAVGALLACPLIIPVEFVRLRAISAVVSADFAFKIVDYFRLCGAIRRTISLRDYYRFLLPFPAFAIVYPDLKRRLLRPDNPWPHILRIVLGTGGVVAAISLTRAYASIPLLRANFVLDHVAMLLAFVLAIESLSRVLFGIERLAGFDTRPIIRNAFLSRTVAEFWQRYNTRVHDWFFRNIFRAVGGRRRPILAVWLVFLISGLFHELMFGIATSVFDGTQLAFFLIQAPAVIASGWFERLARRGGIAGKIAAHGFTILFMASTSILFFHGVRRVFPFIYVGDFSSH
jgi:hypothetical protein